MIRFLTPFGMTTHGGNTGAATAASPPLLPACSSIKPVIPNCEERAEGIYR